MVRLIEMVAVYKLPASLVLSPGCFNKTLDVTIGGLSGKALTPLVKWGNNNEPYIAEPLIDDKIKKYVDHYVTNSPKGRKRWHYWGDVSSWSPKKHIVIGPHIGALLMRFKVDPTSITYSDYLYGRGHPQSQKIEKMFYEIDEWFDRLSAWVEVATDQDADPENSLSSMKFRGNNLHIFTIEKDVVSLPASASHIEFHSHDHEEVKLPILRKLVNYANTGSLPSDAHMLLREGKAAKRRGQHRRAVIDAGSATEITLADFNNRVTRIPAGDRPPLGWYVKQPTIAYRAGLPVNTWIDLVDVRNKAIHQNRTPSTNETITALGLAKQIVDLLDPLPL